MEETIHDIFGEVEESQANSDVRQSLGKPFSDMYDQQRLKNLELQNKALGDQIAQNKEERKMRQDFADKIFQVMCTYLACVFLLIFLSGIQGIYFHLSDTVMEVMLGTTTANILALMVIILSYLFHKRK